MSLRTVVEEREYGVVARIGATDDADEEVPRSDQLAAAYRLQWSCARPSQVIEDDEGIATVVELGDAPDSEFEEVAGRLLEEAESW